MGENNSTPVFYPAFPTNIKTKNFRELGEGDWENFDEIEDDLRTLQDAICSILLDSATSTNIMTQIDNAFEDVKLSISENGMKIKEGSTIILNFFRIIVQQHLCRQYCSIATSKELFSQHFNIINDINICETNIWRSMSVKNKRSCDDDEYQFDKYISQNLPYFETFLSSQKSVIQKLIEDNKQMISRHYITAREGVRNVENYINVMK